jgi:hypothetical protein
MAGAVREQDVDQRVLQAGELRMDTRRNQPQRGRSAGHIRHGINLRAGREQRLRDPYGVVRSSLAVSLDAVSPDIMQKR